MNDPHIASVTYPQTDQFKPSVNFRRLSALPRHLRCFDFSIFLLRYKTSHI